MSYATYKASIVGKVIGDGQCVALSDDYAAKVLPVSWTVSLGSVVGARELFGKASSKYFTKIANDTSNASQLPQQGDIMVFDATPKAGYSNTFDNPYGHTGICDSANTKGYCLLQQNAPAEGQAANVTFYPWKFRPCIGWLRPIAQPAPKAAPKPVAPAPPKETTNAPTQKTTPPTQNAPVETPAPSKPTTQPVQPAQPTPDPEKPAPSVPAQTTTGQNTTPAKPAKAPVTPTPKPTPKVVVVEPTYFSKWELFVAWLKKLIGRL